MEETQPWSPLPTSQHLKPLGVSSSWEGVRQQKRAHSRVGFEVGAWPCTALPRALLGCGQPGEGGLQSKVPRCGGLLRVEDPLKGSVPDGRSGLQSRLTCPSPASFAPGPLRLQALSETQFLSQILPLFLVRVLLSSQHDRPEIEPDLHLVLFKSLGLPLCSGSSLVLCGFCPAAATLVDHPADTHSSFL